uniref:Prolactin-induced protein n=1 Tax=Mus spicilegus TaxID=10103 RepID=A0A8C6G5B1_MUSSI
MYANPYSMASLQKFYQPGAVIYLLIVFLLQETAGFWYHGLHNEPRNYTLTLNTKITPSTSITNKKGNEFRVQLTVKNNVKQCQEVEITTEHYGYIKFLSGPSTFETCICTISDFFWDIYVPESTYLTISASILPYKNKCPDSDEPLLYGDPYQIYNITHEINVTP